MQLVIHKILTGLLSNIVEILPVQLIYTTNRYSLLNMPLGVEDEQQEGGAHADN